MSSVPFFGSARRWLPSRLLPLWLRLLCRLRQPQALPVLSAGEGPRYRLCSMAPDCPGIAGSMVEGPSLRQAGGASADHFGFLSLDGLPPSGSTLDTCPGRARAFHCRQCAGDLATTRSTARASAKIGHLTWSPPMSSATHSALGVIWLTATKKRTASSTTGARPVGPGVPSPLSAALGDRTDTTTRPCAGKTSGYGLGKMRPRPFVAEGSPELWRQARAQRNMPRLLLARCWRSASAGRKCADASGILLNASFSDSSGIRSSHPNHLSGSSLANQGDSVLRVCSLDLSPAARYCRFPCRGFVQCTGFYPKSQ